MRTIKIRKNVKDALDKYSEMNETYDAVINRLLDEVGDNIIRNEKFNGFANIGVSDATFERLQSLKSRNKDSYTKILSDALYSLE